MAAELTHQVRFRVQYSTRYGQNVHVLGDHPSFGAWGTKQGRKMSYVKDGVWELRVALDPEITLLRYKYAVLDHQIPDFGVPHLEPGSDRVIDFTHESGNHAVLRDDHWGEMPQLQQLVCAGWPFPGKLYRSAMPMSTMFDLRRDIFAEWKAANIDVVVSLASQKECECCCNGCVSEHSLHRPTHTTLVPT
eukprot:TRINITY_DN3055_c0_g1_i1.p1 TRINITY_DN3055_c0_g1~~TRINITY_DN3055_c0_g1_i1.p1  ORF type:complete len:191 (+),score=43.22 TRINITY_DN3055_c0_g1_i1:8-580(+)